VELKHQTRKQFGHIGRIMETELGEKLPGEALCNACQTEGQECWLSSELGAKQMM
jgi:hypothetical protein